MKKILTIDGFIYPNEERKLECINTLRWNSNIFDKIFIMAENKNNEDYWNTVINNYKIKNILVKNTDIPHPTCKQQYDFCNQNSTAKDLKFFANIDTIYTKDITKLEKLNLNNKFITFTNRSMRNSGGSYKVEDGDPLDIFNKTLELTSFGWDSYDKNSSLIRVAHCGWGWKDLKEMPEYGAMLGKPGGENKLLRQVRSCEYQVISAALICPTYHNHRSDVRTERYNERIDYAGGSGEISENEIVESI